MTVAPPLPSEGGGGGFLSFAFEPPEVTTYIDTQAGERGAQGGRKTRAGALKMKRLRRLLLIFSSLTSSLALNAPVTPPRHQPRPQVRRPSDEAASAQMWPPAVPPVSLYLLNHPPARKFPRLHGCFVDTFPIELAVFIRLLFPASPSYPSVHVEVLK